MNHSNLKPRAIALLVTIREQPRTIEEVSAAIADRDPEQTLQLASVMDGSEGLIRMMFGVLMLTDRGIAWLQHEGLDPGYRPGTSLTS